MKNMRMFQKNRQENIIREILYINNNRNCKKIPCLYVLVHGRAFEGNLCMIYKKVFKNLAVKNEFIEKKLQLNVENNKFIC